ncbi:MAG: molybdopterin molybdotransferase MoeA [Bacteroidales bacterium]
MITFEEALRITLENASIGGTEIVDFEEAVGRVLSAHVFCDMDLPPFDKSAMDGFACRRTDLSGKMRCVMVIPAGTRPDRPIGRGECAKIMTGSIVPEGADVVIRVEDTVEEGDLVTFKATATAPNICYKGEDAQTGDLILKSGTLLTPRHVPILATAGAVRVEVYQVPQIALLSTGTELVEPFEKPDISQIRNSNAYQMVAQLNAMGIDPDYYGIAPDDEKVTRQMIGEALANSDILVLSGGVSMGEFDFVPGTLKSLGINLLYQKIAIQPGKPTLFGTGAGKYVFGLPGNPVSSYLTMEMLVKPFIYKCMGHNWSPPQVRVEAGSPITRRNTGRLAWVPVRMGPDGLVYAVEYHGSAHILALNQADGIVSLPIGCTGADQGEYVNVRLF